MRENTGKEDRMNNFNDHVLEFARFTLAEGVDETTFLAAADALQVDFLSRQKGFIKRDLVRSADHEWADVIYWESMGSVEQAMHEAPNHPAALRYFQLMANAGQADSSGQMMLMNIARSYS